MKKRTLLASILSTAFASLFAFSTVAQATTITGAGASFPAPIYSKWASDYNKETGVKVNYQAIGSSGGVNQINAKTVDFGASDAPLSDEKLNENGLFQFPTVIGGIVIVVNLPNVKAGELVLNGEVLGDIFLGKIKKWNDPAIKSLNPNADLPNLAINVVRRADGSGTSFVFTSYLSKVNQEWKDKVGAGSSINWPVGVGGKGNEGVSAFVQRLHGSIGYVEYAYAKQSNLAYTKLFTADGNEILPSGETFSAAAENADWDRTFAQDLTNQKGKDAWPITSTTFILVHKKQTNADTANAVHSFFNWAFEKGSKQAIELDYAVLPQSVIDKINNAWDKQIEIVK